MKPCEEIQKIRQKIKGWGVLLGSGEEVGLQFPLPRGRLPSEGMGGFQSPPQSQRECSPFRKPPSDKISLLMLKQIDPRLREGSGLAWVSHGLLAKQDPLGFQLGRGECRGGCSVCDTTLPLHAVLSPAGMQVWCLRTWSPVILPMAQTIWPFSVRLIICFFLFFFWLPFRWS